MEKKKKIFNLFIVILILCSFMSFFIVPTNALSKVKLNKTKTTLYVGQSITLKLSGAKVKKWKSNDKNIATVNKNGKVVAKKKGTTTIVATTKNGKTYKCKITVKNVSLSKTKVTLEKGKSVTLKLNGSKVVKWSSDNKKIATINKNGKVVAKGVGTTTIKAKAKNGKTYKCKVVVSKKENKKDFEFTPDGVLAMLDSAYRAAGFKYYPETEYYQVAPEAGLSGGMGWGLCTVEPGYTYQDALNEANGTANSGYDMYYLEYVETQSDGTIVIKVYRGTY